MIRPKTVDLNEVAAFYNKRASLDPSNPPTRRVVAAAFGDVSPTTAQAWLNDLDERGLLVFRLRRRGVAP